MSEPEAIARLDALIASVRAMRAERWLREWPAGHPERPNREPDYVIEYLNRRAAGANTT